MASKNAGKREWLSANLARSIGNLVKEPLASSKPGPPPTTSPPRFHGSSILPSFKILIRDCFRPVVVVVVVACKWQSRRIPLKKILYHPAITITFYAGKLSNSGNDIVERKVTGSKFRCCNGHEETGWNVIKEFPSLKFPSADGLNDTITVKGKSLEFLNLFGEGSRHAGKENLESSNLTSMLISYYFPLLKFWNCFKSESIFDTRSEQIHARKRNQVQFVLSDRLRGAWLIIPRVPVTNARNAVSFPPKPAANQFQLSSANEKYIRRRRRAFA